MQFNTVEEALEELRNGKIILVTDDPDRENEGDFICAAEFATTENINFMACYGKGLICMPMSEEYVRKLRIPQMVQQNTDNHETAFTVSMWQPQQAFLRQNALSQRLHAFRMMQSLRISADRVTCSLSWQRKTAFWNGKGIPKQPLIYADWQA